MSKKRDQEGRHCAACGARMFPHEEERSDHFMARTTCRTDTCREILKVTGRQFPEYRKPRPTVVEPPRPVLRVPPADLLAARALPFFLRSQPVDKSVENPLNV